MLTLSQLAQIVFLLVSFLIAYTRAVDLYFRFTDWKIGSYEVHNRFTEALGRLIDFVCILIFLFIYGDRYEAAHGLTYNIVHSIVDTMIIVVGALYVYHKADLFYDEFSQHRKLLRMSGYVGLGVTILFTLFVVLL